ncbi:MAG: efflux RND transporter periplasmic adaptor subunit [Acidobacteriota bacterium]
MNEEDEIINSYETTNAVKSTVNRKPIYFAASLVGAVIILALIIWFWRGRETGQVVPAPRNVTFDNSRNEQTPDEEQTITIALDQVERAGVKIETVGETLSSEAATVSSTGVVQANAYAETPVISLVGGVARRINVELGQYVAKGQTVAIVVSDELAQSQSNYLSMIAEADEARKRYDRSLQLADISPEARNELDRAQADSEIARADQTEHMSHFARSAKLLKIGAESREEYEMVRAKHETAMAKLEEATKRLERAKRLLTVNPERKNEIDRTFAQRQSMEAKADAEREKLLVLGLSLQRIDQIRKTRRVSSELPIQSPVSGTVTARAVNSGEVVEANKELMKVTNLSTVWVIAQVYEKDVSRLRVGSGASITTDAYPGRLFRGHVTYIDPNLNPETRTIAARIELENPGQVLKIGMYVNAAFGSLGSAESTVPVIPSSAVQNIDNRPLVFVATDKPNVFILRYVRLGTEADGKYIVLEGLNVGDKIVNDGSFSLRAEWLKQHPGK